MNTKKDKKQKRSKGKIVVAVSGGFDPVHIGHVRLFKGAKKLGDELVVILNNDNWLRKKKGYAFMPASERKEMIESLAGVDRVVLSSHKQNPADMSVARELQALKPDIFANGGDRNKKDAATKTSSLNADQLLCRQLGIKIVFNVGDGGKVQSSSWLLNKYKTLAKSTDSKRKRK